jgi:hypothetical protein
MMTSYISDEAVHKFPGNILRTNEALPAGSPYRKIMLTGEELLGFATVAVSQVGLMSVAAVQTQALSREPDGSING